MKKGGSEYDIGIDVGAISTKAVVLDREGKAAARGLAGTTMEPGKLARSLMASTLKDAGIGADQVGYVVATGQGRRSVDFADLARTEITAFARGAHFLDPSSEILVDMGGQGIRVMRRDSMGIIEDFRTNDKCSSGTGSFLDTMAQALDVDMEEAGRLSLTSCGTEEVCATCTVFAESEVVSLVARGKGKEEILSGINRMVAKKVTSLVNSMRSKGSVFFGGGVSCNEGVIKELRAVLNREMFVPGEPQFVGAVGAALISPGRAVEKPEVVTTAEGAGQRDRSLLRFFRRGWA